MWKRISITIIAAAALIAPAGAAVATPAGASPTGALLQQKLDAIHAAGMPGAFAEVRDGRRTWTPVTGVIDIRTQRPVRDGFRHRIGSLTKTFVATTMLQLAGEGRVRLDAPVGRYLPRLVTGETGRRVTVRMLLNHTSGIGDYDTVILSSPESRWAGPRTGRCSSPASAWASRRPTRRVSGIRTPTPTTCWPR